MENSVEQSSDLRPCQGAVLHNSHASLNDIVVGAAKPPRNTLSSDLPQANWPIHDQYIDTIVKAFTPNDHGSFISPKSSGREPQICGSWVEVLPHLSVGCDPHGALPKAIKALFASIVQPGPHQASERLDPIQAYHSAIKSLRRALPIPGYQNRAESAATMMCLCLAELMLPGSSTGPEMHARGITALFETHGPSAVRQGFLHKLYAGFLPLVVLEAFRDRKPTFVASEEWQNVPFSVTPPSAMQRLLGEAAIIPSILYKIDSTCHTWENPNLAAINGNFASLMAALSRLDGFEYPVNSHKERACRSFGQGTSDNTYCFPDIITANMLTHLWSFKLADLTGKRTILPP
ncbi:hypothetical protein BDV32DRAFT_143732 [Aspergillus pseudonomiae]|nr:hypothetical protein BDV32DRAFT_143732 [Aspergillus pseudonomiae]